MKNRNMLIFIVLSTLLLGGYNIFMARNSSSIRTSYTNANSSKQTANPAVDNFSNNSSSKDVNNKEILVNQQFNSFVLSNQTIKLMWNKTSGALTQVVWSDGTNFFPEHNDGIGSSKYFPGLGVALNTTFSGDPLVVNYDGGQTVTFKSGNNDTLVYRIPNQGYIVNVDWNSRSCGALGLIPKPNTLMAAEGLGRVFAIKPDSIRAVSWASILKDPFFSFLGMKREELPMPTRWVGMDAGVNSAKQKQDTHYFAVIWETQREPQSNIAATPGYILAPDATGTVSARLYLGPKQAEMLASFSNSGNQQDGEMFKRIVDFGFFGLVAKLLFIVLHGIHSVVPNWGWAIILFAVVIRGALWPLNTKTTIQTLRMKELEPFQKALQAKYEKFGSDINKKAEMQKELMAFYKKNNHNPMGGCLPALLQMPVFFALWSMLNAVFELRNAPFLLWLVDLSASDPYHVLPVLMGISMVIQQMLAPAVGDPNQRKITMVLMPIMFSFFFFTAPSGLCLYYLTFNIISIFQTWLVIKNYKSRPVNI